MIMQILKLNAADNDTLIIAGIARSGLTMTMQMLDAGGYPCFGRYPAYEDYEIGKIDWDSAKGKAIKLPDTQNQFPPKNLNFKVIMLNRDLTEQAKSTERFIRILMGIQGLDHKDFMVSIKRDKQKVNKWRSAYESIVLNFEDIINEPKKTAEHMNDFLGGGLDVEKMAQAVIKRTDKCHERLLELEFNYL